VNKAKAQTNWEKAMNAMLETTAPEKRKTAGRAKREILLVDDDPAIRRIIPRLLAEEGYSAHTAADGAQALQLASVMDFDLVLLDLNMPFKDGWQTLEALLEKNPALPVIIITARPNQFFTALASGVGALLEKPLDFTNLFKSIRELLAETPAERLARTAGQPAPFHYISSIPGRR
jgi:DNA-binding response OmpR family regulator